MRPGVVVVAPPMPKTTVWGYGGMVQTLSGPVYLQNSPAATFEATRGIPINVYWVNNMTGSQLFAVDPALHWADPNNMGMPMSPFPVFPPGFPRAQSPVPLVTHLHGGEVRSDSDGGPDHGGACRILPAAKYHRSQGQRDDEAVQGLPRAQSLSTFSISSNKEFTRSPAGTLRIGLPWAKMRPSPLPPAMP